MGYGDEILGTGLARGAHARGKRVAFGDGKRIIWGPWCPEIFENNKNIARPGTENTKDLEWVPHYKGNRSYNRQDNGKWVWNYDFKAVPGEFFFTESDQCRAQQAGTDFIVFEPNVPWNKTVAPNKDWGEGKYEHVAQTLMRAGHRVVQFKHKNSRRIIRGAHVIESHRFRDVVAMLSRAKLYVGPEGGMHHAAAAVGVRAVVLFGGFIPPQVTGYDIHVNLTGGAEACGSYVPCNHCRRALDKISVEEVEDQATRLLS